MPPRNSINREKLVEKTYKLADLKEGDVVKFKGTRDRHGIRKIMQMSLYSYTCRVMMKVRDVYVELPHMSVNGIDKLTQVLIQGEWVKVIQ